MFVVIAMTSTNVVASEPHYHAEKGKRIDGYLA
jgi:hypothetical protein